MLSRSCARTSGCRFALPEIFSAPLSRSCLAVASLPCEILPSREFYDYEDKYLLDKAQTKVPAELAEEKTQELRRLAVECYRAVECEGMARVDFLLETSTGKLYINEINTIPGFTSISMYPKMWEHSGISFSALIDQLLKSAYSTPKPAVQPSSVWPAG